MTDTASRDCFAHCEELVRRGDKDRFLATLFAPADKRSYIFALYAFNLEIARIRDAVSDALPGEMRLQWWRDALHGCGHGEVMRHPVAAALLETVERCELSAQPFLDLIEARSFDIYDDAMPTVTHLEAYSKATSSVPMEIAAAILGAAHCTATSTMIDHGGIAYAITGLLRAMPFHASSGQIFLPEDVLRRHGADYRDILAGKDTPQLRAALADLRGLARSHLEDAGNYISAILPQAIPAVLPIALVRPYLDRMERPDYAPFAEMCVVPQWRRQWILWRAARQAACCCA
ncbi:phytoene/squalene synthase family protein [Microbaculum marinum]|uniref:Phytoene/squalene synthase family protein n=1 Tax=Microbaculum marinum TaxID=1764581 RepID=A0AAW9RHX4_9HYPH